jgi:hypothetical protein
MSINTGSFAAALYPGVNKWFGRDYKDYSPEWASMFEQFKSKRNYEEDVGISSFGLASIKNEGSSIGYDTEQQGFVTRYVMFTVGKGFIVTREAFEDDQYGVIAPRRARGLARAMHQTKETHAANVYNRATNSSYTGGDGKEMVSTAHVNVAGGTWSNESSTSAALSEASLEQAVIDMAGWTDDRGLKIAVRPKKLIIPVALSFEAERILKSSKRVATAENDLNALLAMGAIPEVMVAHYLTSTTRWFLRTDVADGLKCFNRRDVSFDMDNEFDTENAKFKATARYVFGWTDPRGIYGSDGA